MSRRVHGAKKWTSTTTAAAAHGYRAYRAPLTFPKLINVNNMYRLESHNRPQLAKI